MGIYYPQNVCLLYLWPSGLGEYPCLWSEYPSLLGDGDLDWPLSGIYYWSSPYRMTKDFACMLVDCCMGMVTMVLEFIQGNYMVIETAGFGLKHMSWVRVVVINHTFCFMKGGNRSCLEMDRTLLLLFDLWSAYYIYDYASTLRIRTQMSTVWIGIVWNPSSSLGYPQIFLV